MKSQIKKPPKGGFFLPAQIKVTSTNYGCGYRLQLQKTVTVTEKGYKRLQILRVLTLVTSFVTVFVTDLTLSNQHLKAK